MTRVKKGLTKRRKHKKILTLTKGYRGARSRLVKTAKEAAMHAGEYAYVGRKQKKRQKRRLWITKINAFLKNEGVPYNKFIKGLKESNIVIDRKILADLAVSDPPVFKKIISKLNL
ncbi:50S ribosomal protein L20 [Patescibacteria group bacterium]|nr:50S ribosomal protein L20 [Patescibacteria group bacterium]